MIDYLAVSLNLSIVFVNRDCSQLYLQILSSFVVVAIHFYWAGLHLKHISKEYLYNFIVTLAEWVGI